MGNSPAVPVLSGILQNCNLSFHPFFCKNDNVLCWHVPDESENCTTSKDKIASRVGEEEITDFIAASFLYFEDVRNTQSSLIQTYCKWMYILLVMKKLHKTKLQILPWICMHYFYITLFWPGLWTWILCILKGYYGKSFLPFAINSNLLIWSYLY